MMTFHMKLLKAKWQANQQEQELEFKRHVIWQMMMAMLQIPIFRSLISQ